MTSPDTTRGVRIFCDADVLIAGAASTTGASHILLCLSELTLIDCVTSGHAISEAERNLLAKLPTALPAFRIILRAAVSTTPPPPASVLEEVAPQAHAKDVPILAAAIASGADFLATFNVRHFQSRKTAPIIVQPRAVVKRIRSLLSSLQVDRG